MSTKRWSTIKHNAIDPTQHPMVESATQNYPLGACLELVDGRTFRYCKNGAVDLAAGKFVATPLVATEREDTLTVAAAAGERSITYTAVGTITANQYADGLLCIVDGAGQGLQYKIEKHEAIAAGSTGTIYLYDPIVTALDTTTDVILMANEYKDVVVAPDQIVLPVGVPCIPVTAAYYFWAQTRGVCPVLAEDSLGNLATERVCVLGTTGGYLSTDGGVGGAPRVGKHIFDSTDGVATDYFPIFLDLER